MSKLKNEEDPHPHPDDPEPTIEQKLLNFGSSAVRWAQSPGYMPLSKRTRGQGLTLRLRPCSGAFVYNLLMTLVSIFMFFVFLLRELLEHANTQYTRTEKMVNSLIGIIYIYTIYLKVSSSFNAKRGVIFWKRVVRLFETLGTYTSLDLTSPRILQVSRHLWKRNLSYFIGGFILMAYEFMSSFATTEYFYDDYNHEFEPEFIRTDAWWFLVTFLHLGYSIWLSYFVFLFRVGFEAVGVTLLEINGDGAGDSQNHLKGQGDFVQDDLNSDSHVFSTATTTGSQRSTSPPGTGTPFIDDDVQEDEKGTLKVKIKEEPNFLETRIRTALDMFNRIEEEVHAFNKVMGRSLVIEMPIMILFLLVNFYAAYNFYEGHPYYVIFEIGVTSLLYCHALIHLSGECSMLTERAQEIILTLERLPLGNVSQDLRFKIQLISARVWASPPSVTGRQYFTLNRELLTSVLGTVATYLIVLVQFADEEKGDDPTPPPVQLFNSSLNPILNLTMNIADALNLNVSGSGSPI